MIHYIIYIYYHIYILYIIYIYYHIYILYIIYIYNVFYIIAYLAYRPSSAELRGAMPAPRRYEVLTCNEAIDNAATLWAPEGHRTRKTKRFELLRIHWESMGILYHWLKWEYQIYWQGTPNTLVDWLLYIYIMGIQL